ncbi:MAG: hypothetical protein L3J35_13250 [Bacteroidales bacterium]|nr:hypothetical protein [Bacteroidales bacterium]
MEIQDFKDYIADPVKIKEEDFDKIKSLLEKYPFFHSANLLFIKAAHNVSKEIYDSAISRISASVPNREILHELIILKEIKVIPVKKEEKEKAEESQTRKDIRKRIQKRRTKRRVDKGESLKENGKPKHESLIRNFFEPIISKLLKSPEDYSVVVSKDETTDIVTDNKTTEVSVADKREQKRIEREKRMTEKRKLRAEQTSDEDREKARAEREKKKIEREKRMAEKRKLREEQTPKEGKEKNNAEREQKKAEREKRRAERKKLKENDTQKIDEKIKDKKTEEINDEIIIETELPENIDIKSEDKSSEKNKDNEKDPFTKIISIPSKDDKKDSVPEIKKEKDEKIEIKTEKDIKSKKDKIKPEKEHIIVEEIKTADDTFESDNEGLAIDSIYDKIITSKKQNPTENSKPFVKITDDISDLTSYNEETKEDKKTETEIKIDSITDNKKETVTDEIKIDTVTEKGKGEIITDIISEDKKETLTNEIKIEIETKPASEEIKIETEVKDEINNEIKTKKKEEISIKTDDTGIKDLKDEDIEFIVENTTDSSEIKIVTEDKDSSKIIIEGSKEEAFELIEKKEDAVSDKKTEIKTEKVADVKKDEKEAKQKTDTEKEKKRKIAEAKAANDVFARIAAYKNKKKNTSQKEETVTEPETKKTDDLIQKFVDKKPSLKRKEIDDSENIDISEESTKIKKPVTTELMASIYINQGKYDQAIEIYEKLILKNPEKKDYFAAKINETKNLK